MAFAIGWYSIRLSIDQKIEDRQVSVAASASDNQRDNGDEQSKSEETNAVPRSKTSERDPQQLRSIQPMVWLANELSSSPPQMRYKRKPYMTRYRGKSGG